MAALCKRLLLISFSFALLSAGDGHVLLIQSFAWARMAYSFSHHDSMKTAMKKTFDGKHPCEICKTIGKIKPTSNLAGATAEPLKMLGLLVQPRLQAPHFYEPKYITKGKIALEEVHFAPPKPPPRAV